MAADAPPARRLSVGELRRECESRGLSTAGCLERADLEALLAGSDGVRAAPSAEPRARAPAAPAGSLAEAQAELESWVGYGPRAVTLLEHLGACELTVPVLRQTKLGFTVRRYTKHPDRAVAARASELIKQWMGVLRKAQEARRAAAAPEPNGEGSSDSSEASSGDDEDAGESGGESCVEVVDPGGGGAEKAAAGQLPAGWQEATQTQVFRGKKERFHVFTLKRPFGAAKWAVRVRISHSQHRPECRELLERMAADFGAAAAAGDAMREEDQQVITRLQRLEDRFRGTGVTEGEARNAMRLFERELSKANWTEEKFVKLKRQMAGTEEWSAADAIAETALVWLEKGRRRQAWFADACTRVAMPLGLESGYCDNGGCCFAGPLSAAAGAALTTALVSHLADLDLQRAMHSKGRSRISSPQFLQGFVDGALERERHLVWERFFSIEDGEEAARFCEESRRSGFFDSAAGSGGDGGSEPGSDGEELHSMLRNLFSARRGSGGGGGGGRPSAEERPQPRARRRPEAPAAHLPSPPSPTPHEYTPFSGKGQRLGEEASPPAAGGSSSSGSGGSGGKPLEQQSWALTFASNLELVRSSKQRSRAEARKSYHWTFSGHAVKPTQTGTESYSRGREAGRQRKREIDGAAGSARRKFGKKPRLAIER